MKPVIDHYEFKKRDELGLGPWRLMEEQKKTVIEFVHLQKTQGQSITKSLRALGIKRSTQYTWLNPKQKKHALS